MILMSMVLVCLLSLPLMLVYFLHITFSSLKKCSSMKRKRSTTKMTSYALKKYAINDYCSFDWKKSIEDSIKDGLIITATTTGIFYVIKAANVKPPKACYGYHETCWWNSGWCPCQGLCSLQKMDQRVIQQNILWPS